MLRSHVDPSSFDHDGHHHPGDHPVHAAEEDLQAAGSLPSDGPLPAGRAADGGRAAALPAVPRYRWGSTLNIKAMPNKYLC